jgi:two-component system osmolarity sensor histidine kinase EnvZ
MPDIEVSTDIAPGIEVMGNETDLKRVIGNLVENARRYGKTTATQLAQIDIICRAEGDKAVIEVADHGIGVPDGDLEHLLRPFTRMDAARGQANGAGLGLAIVDRVVKRHGAALRLFNRAGGGLVVQITMRSVKNLAAAAA